MTTAGRCHPGDILGMVDGDILQIGSDETEVAIRTLEKMLSAGAGWPRSCGDRRDRFRGHRHRSAPGGTTPRRRTHGVRGWSAAVAAHLRRRVRGDSGPSLTWDDSLKGPVGVGLRTPWPGVRHPDRGRPAHPLSAPLPDPWGVDRPGHPASRRLRDRPGPDQVDHPHSYLDRRRNRRAVRTELVVTDGTGDLLLTFFQARGLNRLRAGQLGLFSGQVGTFRGESPNWCTPNTNCWTRSPTRRPGGAGRPVRRLAHPGVPRHRQGAQPGDSQGRSYAAAASGALADPLPADIRARLGLVDRDTAVRTIHEPDSREAASAARRRLAFDEPFLLQTVLAQRRHHAEHMGAAAGRSCLVACVMHLTSNPHLVLTAGQVSVGTRIEAGLAGSRPMHLLLRGRGDREDPGGPARHAAGGGCRCPGCPAGAHRGPGAAALHGDHPAAGTVGRGRPPGGAEQGTRWRC